MRIYCALEKLSPLQTTLFHALCAAWVPLIVSDQSEGCHSGACSEDARYQLRGARDDGTLATFQLTGK